MADINVSTNTRIKLDNEEIEVLKKAYSILQDIQTELWRNDADETEAFGNIMCASDCIYMFMRDEIGIDMEEMK